MLNNCVGYLDPFAWPFQNATTPFQFFVKTLTRKTITIDMSASWSVGSLKAIVEKSEGIPVDAQRLILSGRQLEPDNTPLYMFKLTRVYDDASHPPNARRLTCRK